MSPWPPRWPWGCHCCTQRLREVLCVLLPPGRPSASPFAADLGDAHPLPGPRTHGTGRKGPVFTTTLYKASFYKKTTSLTKTEPEGSLGGRPQRAL